MTSRCCPLVYYVLLPVSTRVVYAFQSYWDGRVWGHSDDGSLGSRCSPFHGNDTPHVREGKETASRGHFSGNVTSVPVEGLYAEPALEPSQSWSKCIRLIGTTGTPIFNEVKLWK